MGFLIDGNKQDADDKREIVAQDNSNEFIGVSDSQLRRLYIQTEKDISRYNNFQMARKIALNSAYGACGNVYFRYYKLANAEAITLSGQIGRAHV